MRRFRAMTGAKSSNNDEKSTHWFHTFWVWKIVLSVEKTIKNFKPLLLRMSPYEIWCPEQASQWLPSWYSIGYSKEDLTSALCFSISVYMLVVSLILEGVLSIENLFIILEELELVGSCLVLILIGWKIVFLILWENYRIVYQSTLRKFRGYYNLRKLFLNTILNFSF